MFPGSRRILRITFSRITSAIIASVIAWIGPEHIPMSPEKFHEVLTLAIFGIVFSAGHKLIDMKVNPSDDAAPKEAKET